MKKFKKPLIITLIIVAIFAALIIFVQISLNGKFAPGTEIANINIAYLTPSEALEKIQPQIDTYLKKYHTLHFQNQLIKLTPEDLGVQIPIADTLSTIPLQNKNFNPLDLLFAFANKKKHNIIVTIDRQKLQNTLNQKLKLHEIAPKSASFYAENNELKIQPSTPGLETNLDKLAAELKTLAQKSTTTDLILEATPAEPQVQTAELEAQKDQIIAKLQNKITLRDPVYSSGWTIQFKDHLDWLEFSTSDTLKLPLINEIQIANPEGKNIQLKLNQEKLNQYIDENISKWLDKPATSTKISFDENGKITPEGEGKDGLEIQRTKLKSAIELALNYEIPTLDVPVYTTPAALDIDPKIQAMGIKERIGQGHTTYYGSPTNRTHNIKVAAANFNGLLIQPGQEFSFNTNLGPVDASTGYRKELVIKQEGTIPEFGGGVCQVSTTMYRAALLSGLEITDRREHSYAVSYYSQVLGHGLDATIYLGGQDLKFRNDTTAPILIHTYVDKDYELYINLYGTADGRKVELDGPYIYGQTSPGATQYIDTPSLPVGQTKQQEKAHGGFAVDWNYKLFSPTGELKKTDTIKTRYKSVPAKILVGTGA